LAPDAVESVLPCAVAVSTATFTERDGRTTLSLLVQHQSKASRDAHVNSGMESDIQESMSHLEQSHAPWREAAGAGLTATRPSELPFPLEARTRAAVARRARPLPRGQAALAGVCLAATPGRGLAR
jgi:hypothetical protein